MKKYMLGIDSGGTNMRIGLVDEEGTILKYKKESNIGIKTMRLNVFTDQLVRMSEEMLSDSELKNLHIEGIGIGSSGQINAKGEMFGHNKAPDYNFKPVPIRQIVSEKIGLPVCVVNDSQAAIFGEALFGAGKNYKDIVGFTIGTGIGGAVILNRRIHFGATGLAGHLGFLVIDYKGKMSLAEVPGAVEDLASGTAIENIAKERIRENPLRGEKLLSLVNGDISAISCFTLCEAARQGDPFSLEVINDCGTALGYAAASMVHALNPDIIILAGGVAEQGDLILNPVRNVIRNHVIWTVRNTPVVIAQLGSRAGVVGAAALFLD